MLCLQKGGTEKVLAMLKAVEGTARFGVDLTCIYILEDLAMLKGGGGHKKVSDLRFSLVVAPPPM